MAKCGSGKKKKGAKSLTTLHGKIDKKYSQNNTLVELNHLIIYN